MDLRLSSLWRKVARERLLEVKLHLKINLIKESYLRKLEIFKYLQSLNINRIPQRIKSLQILQANK